MCDPVTLGIMAVSAAASVAGGGLSARASLDNQNNIAAARNKVLQETNATNLKHAADSRAALLSTLGKTTGDAADQGLAQTQAQTNRNVQANITPSADAPVAAGDAPTVVKTSLAKAISDAADKSKSNAGAMANLQGYNLFNRQTGFGDQELTNDINLNNDAVRGNMALLPSLQDYEQIKADNGGTSTLGDILSGAGSLGAGYAGSRVGGGTTGLGALFKSQAAPKFAMPTFKI